MTADGLNIGIDKSVDHSYDETVARTRAALKEEGFGVLTEIDVQSTLKEKLGVEMRRYVILGACNPPLAHRALESNPDVGLLLPCNVIVYESDEGCRVAAVNPDMMVQLVDNEAMQQVAQEAKEKLARAIEAI